MVDGSMQTVIVGTIILLFLLILPPILPLLSIKDMLNELIEYIKDRYKTWGFIPEDAEDLFSLIGFLLGVILIVIGIILVCFFKLLLWPIFLIKKIIKKIITFSRRRRLRKYEYNLEKKLVSLSEVSERFERKLLELGCSHSFQSVVHNLNIFIDRNINSSLNPDELNDLFDLIFKIYDIFSFLLPVYDINNTKLTNSVNNLLDNFFATDFRNQEFDKCKNIVNNIINHKLFVVSLLIKVYDKLKCTEYLNKLKIEYNYFDKIIQHLYDEVQNKLKIGPTQYKIETDHYIQSVIDEAKKCYETACELEEKHKSLYLNALELKEKNIRKSDHRLIDNYIDTIKQLFHSSEFKTQDFDKHREKLNKISERFDIIKRIKNYPSGYKENKKQVFSCFKDKNRDLIFLLAGCSNNLSPLTDLLHNQLKSTNGYKILNESGNLHALDNDGKNIINQVNELAGKIKELNVRDFYELYRRLGILEKEVITSIESVYNQSYDKKITILTEEWYVVYNCWHLS